MYDITKYESFKSLEFWFETTKSVLGNNNDYLMILLRKKLDLVNNNSEKRQGSKEESLIFCEKNTIFFGD